MGKTSNIITMLNILSSGRKYSVRELAGILETNTRMVRIYKEDLEKAGIFVDAIRGPYGGYVLNQKVKLPSREFDEEEIALLEKVLCDTPEPLAKEKLLNLFDKINSIYKECKQAQTELSERDRLIFNRLNSAIRRREKILLKYNSQHTGKGINERIIHPFHMTLLPERRGWWVTAFCEKSKAMRSFELVDIVEMKTLKEKF